MKYLFLALMIVFGASASAETRTITLHNGKLDQETLDYLQKSTEAINNQPHKSAEEYHKDCIKMLGPVEKQNLYYGPGIETGEHDVYINGKKYHCIEYKSETQCHID